MKTIGAILFSVFFLLTTMQEASIFLLYKLNEKSITEQYCINKEVKGSCCKGSCHLAKTIAKVEREDTKNPFSSLNIKLKEVEIICQQLTTIQFPVLLFQLTHKSFYSSVLLEGFSLSLIKPPAVVG